LAHPTVPISGLQSLARNWSATLTFGVLLIRRKVVVKQMNLRTHRLIPNIEMPVHICNRLLDECQGILPYAFDLFLTLEHYR
jgi:hypothetical protein